MILRFLKYIILLTISLFLAFFLFFIYLQFSNILKDSNSFKLKKTFLSNLENIDKTRSPLICFQTANDISNETNTKITDFLPFGSIPNSYNDKNKDIFFDKFGFRNHQNLWLDKKKEKVLVLGDSVVMSSNLPHNILFTSLMNRKGLSTLNLGCNGNGILINASILLNFIESSYKTKEVLFFINLNNDLTKDTMREYKSGYLNHFFEKGMITKSPFDNEVEYNSKFLEFLKTSLQKQVNIRESKRNLLTYFSFNNFIILFKDKLNMLFYTKPKEVQLISNNSLLENQVASNIYNVETYMLFLKILENISNISKNNKVKITFVLVPGDAELIAYNSRKQTVSEWRRYWSFRQVKSDIMNKISSFDFDLIDLFDFYERNKDDKIFIKGHLTENGHSKLSDYLIESYKNTNKKDFSKLIIYNSHYPSQHFNNLFTSNFNNTLSIEERKEWMELLIELYKKDLVDPFLYTPFLGYSMMNNDCDSIRTFIKHLKVQDSEEASVLLFKGVCGLNNEKDIAKSIDLIKRSIELKVDRYFPIIIQPIKKKILDYENKV